MNLRNLNLMKINLHRSASRSVTLCASHPFGTP